MTARDQRRDPSLDSLDADLFETIEAHESADNSGFDEYAEAGEEGFAEPEFGTADDQEPYWEAPAAAQEPGSGRGTLILCAATFTLLAGLGTGAWMAIAKDTVPLTLIRIGLSPTLLCMTSLVLFTLWSIRRQQEAADLHAFAALDPLHSAIDGIANEVAASDDSQSIQHALSSLQRLDEKVSNLSRATKMYGKPLIEVANKVERGATKIAELETTLKKVVDQVSSSSGVLASDLGKIRAALPSGDALNAEKFDELVVATKQATAMVEELKTDIESAPRSDGAIAALQTSVDAVQGQVAALATTIEKLESAPPAAAPSAPAATQSRKKRSTADQEASSPAPAAAKAKPGNNSGLANTIAGERKTGGKNVLGAIQKLKQMRN